MFIDEAVLRRSIAEAGSCWGEVFSLLPDVWRESHEKGPVNFLGGGAGAGMLCLDGGGGGGGGPQGIKGKEPESPCVRKGTFGGGPAGCAVSLLEVVSTDRDLGEISPLFSPRCTSSRDVIEIR